MSLIQPWEVLPADLSRLDDYLSGVEQLPPTPALLVRLMELFRQVDTDIDEVVHLLSQDPALTAEVLRRCNSAFFGSGEPVLTVDEAILRLGFYEVYRITVALFGRQSVTGASLADDISVDLLWRHCAITAIASGALSRELGECEAVAFTAGLLHDIGKIVLASGEGKRYSVLLQQHGWSGSALEGAEREKFGFTHAEIGALLLFRWGMPESVCVPVLNHHAAEWSGVLARPSAIVSLANVLAGFIDSPEGLKAEGGVAHPALAAVGICPENLPALVNLVKSDVRRLGSVLIGAK